MKGFKDSTKACYSTGGKVSAAKVGKVMGEWGKGELHSGSAKGPVVKNQKQAIAIALSEGKKAANKATGGYMKNAPADVMRQARQMVRRNPDTALKVANQMGTNQLRTDLSGVKPAGMAAPRPSLVGLKKGGAAKTPIKRAMGGSVGDNTVDESSEAGVMPTRAELAADRARRDAAIRDAQKYGSIDAQRAQLKAMAAGPAPKAKPKPTYTDVPMIDNTINAVRSSLGFKKGGFAVMPKGKGKC